MPHSSPTHFNRIPPSKSSSKQPLASGMFHQAHDFVVNSLNSNTQYIDNIHSGSGLEFLFHSSMPDAFHDAGARYPPPKCHLGTRTEYIDRIMSWALGESDHKEPLLWMKGPFDVGKSAVAQSFAEELDRRNKLAATIFFSRSNADRDDPQRIFPSLVYQLAALCEVFRDVAEARIQQNPALLTKSLSRQFEELLVRPLSQVRDSESKLPGRVIIIDGLDECRDTAEQCEIIRIIATSARNSTTPFRWFITSRPEDRIVRTMTSDAISPVSFHLELPASREIDHEILLYLTDEFDTIRTYHKLPDSWPSEKDISILVERTSGLWIYAATIVRFMRDQNSLGPEDQLRIVLQFAEDVTARVDSDNPWAEMDFLYTLIMRQVPSSAKSLLRKILLLSSSSFYGSGSIWWIAIVLGLSVEQIRRACALIPSVLELRVPSLSQGGPEIHFYHASFLDFMKDSKRSTDLCVYGDFLIEYRRELLNLLTEVCSHTTDRSNIVLPSRSTVLEDASMDYEYLPGIFHCFWTLCGEDKLDHQTASAAVNFPFRKLFKLFPDEALWHINERILDRAQAQTPPEFRNVLIRRLACPIFGCQRAYNGNRDRWVLGHGKNQVATMSPSFRSSHMNLCAIPHLTRDQCSCGADLTFWGRWYWKTRHFWRRDRTKREIDA
ncbi:hypothetical protein NP233_g1663 [Leucocoprinus birnbaumii]|uniref:Nephrocystin 3-like N-terminal domain-containing protein n=1 Tax=Leucocoprinus birnbaumii TaxID=56174 RepID=A0AAD5YZC8_9AGAR|nr:hypothetical protein NP233_g1663 [Leucocoprinus birnbaumii]